MEKLLTEAEAGKILGWSTATLQNRRWKRQPPRFIKIGRSIRYRSEDLQAFLTDHLVEPRASAEASK